MEHSVVSSLRKTLASTRNERKLAEEVGERIHQLIAGMVDGRVLPPAEAQDVRDAIYAFVRKEALPALARRDPDHAVRLLKKVAACEPWTKVSLADELVGLQVALSVEVPGTNAAFVAGCRASA